MNGPVLTSLTQGEYNFSTYLEEDYQEAPDVHGDCPKTWCGIHAVWSIRKIENWFSTGFFLSLCSNDDVTATK